MEHTVASEKSQQPEKSEMASFPRTETLSPENTPAVESVATATREDTAHVLVQEMPRLPMTMHPDQVFDLSADHGKLTKSVRLPEGTHEIYPGKLIGAHLTVPNGSKLTIMQLYDSSISVLPGGELEIEEASGSTIIIRAPATWHVGRAYRCDFDLYLCDTIPVDERIRCKTVTHEPKKSAASGSVPKPEPDPSTRGLVIGGRHVKFETTTQLIPSQRRGN